MTAVKCSHFAKDVSTVAFFKAMNCTKIHQQSRVTNVGAKRGYDMKHETKKTRCDK
ncbi:hypothetical protein AA0119_g9701 [Alternaria tenuissima]|uniref:Uncharacterized protein n=1 Tax=Alternaria tenuissima TaxID=119927 RepID=A0AB37W2T8_9PLEO|nr:hypothetical protein AA0115_g11829 [Alternaria tenuissima]RYN80544.1 hypothetical protein AA0120_g10323 [Alternaria tenuissima]RYN93263.1 hypothetical protein AA0119_g9701 [Alternaria tenuissima]RYO09912.1 hypothetical protein AA0121_g10743 [Alternaria tenuissima]